jgi:hypothetical protein
MAEVSFNLDDHARRSGSSVAGDKLFANKRASEVYSGVLAKEITSKTI